MPEEQLVVYVFVPVPPLAREAQGCGRQTTDWSLHCAALQFATLDPANPGVEQERVQLPPCGTEPLEQVVTKVPLPLPPAEMAAQG